jgi:hypothetical protein
LWQAFSNAEPFVLYVSTVSRPDPKPTPQPPDKPPPPEPTAPQPAAEPIATGEDPAEAQEMERLKAESKKALDVSAFWLLRYDGFSFAARAFVGGKRKDRVSRIQSD